MKKRVLRILLCIVMLCSLLPAAALAADSSKSFTVNFDSRDAVDPVKYQIGSAEPVAAASGAPYDYADGGEAIKFILTPPSDRAADKPVVGLRDTTNDTDIDKLVTPVEKDGRYEFSITPNALTSTPDITFEVFIWWSEFDQFGPGENQYMLQTNVPGGEENGRIRVDPMPKPYNNNGETWMYLGEDKNHYDPDTIRYNEVKYLYSKGETEREITVIVTPAFGKVLYGLHLGDEKYGFPEDTPAGLPLPDLKPDGSCEVTVTAASNTESEHVYVEAIFAEVGDGRVPAKPSNLRWEGNMAVWDPVADADNYGICLEIGHSYEGYGIYYTPYYPDEHSVIFTDGECRFDFSSVGYFTSSGTAFDRFAVFATEDHVRSETAFSPDRTAVTITFDANGGTVNISSQSTYTFGKLPMQALPTPTRDGFTFEGWFTAAVGGTEVTIDHLFTSDTTIYAQWNDGSSTPTTYTVTYTDGVDGVEIFPNQINSGIAKGSATPPFNGTPTRSGYTFAGWTPAVSAAVEEDVTYTATWKRSYIPVISPKHSCTSKCAFCGGCTDENCTYAVCKNKCRLSDMRFADVEEDKWYSDAIAYVYHYGMMEGVGNDLFDPDGTTSRAMIVTILWRLEGSPVVNYAVDFEDVGADRWYTEAIRWAASEKIAEGYGNGKFGTNDAITREQLVTIMYRYAKYKGCDVSIGESTNILSYDDAFEVAEWSIPAVQWACGSGMIEGIAVGDRMDLAPQGNATRAQAAAILQRYCENVVDK